MKTIKRFCVILITLLACVSFVACDEESHKGQAITPSGSIIQQGRNYKTVIKEFKNHGFKNIKTKAIDDLILGWFKKDGDVESVSVDGDTDYDPDEWYSNDVEVVITYHTFPKDDSEKESKEPSTGKTQISSSQTEETQSKENKKETKSKSKQKKTKKKKLPIKKIDGFTLLQSLYLNIKPNINQDALYKLGNQCGFYVSYGEGTNEYHTYLYIALKNKPSKDSFLLEYDVDYIEAYYNTLHSKHKKLSKLYYHFSPDNINVEYSAEGNAYSVNEGVYAVDTTTIYTDAKSALKEAKKLVNK